MNDTKMTLTERNQKLYELRKSLDKARAQVAWIEQEIWLVNDKYDRQDLDLFNEMFGDSVKVPSIYTDTVSYTHLTLPTICSV